MTSRLALSHRVFPALVATALLGVALSSAGCRKKTTPPRIKLTDVAACEAGVQKATKIDDPVESSRVYHESCSVVHAEAVCRDAYKAAGSAPLDEQMKVVVEGCRKAYCPVLGQNAFAICAGDFKPTKEGIQASWPAFHAAIVKHDGQKLSQRVSAAMLRYYVHSMKLQEAGKKAEAEPKPAGDAGAAVNAGDAAPEAAPSGAAPPAASAAPTPSATP